MTQKKRRHDCRLGSLLMAAVNRGHRVAVERHGTGIEVTVYDPCGPGHLHINGDEPSDVMARAYREACDAWSVTEEDGAIVVRDLRETEPNGATPGKDGGE